jgi:hypothetical protein
MTDDDTPTTDPIRQALTSRRARTDKVARRIFGEEPDLPTVEELTREREIARKERDEAVAELKRFMVKVGHGE